jgi:hypothetical protein
VTTATWAKTVPLHQQFGQACDGIRDAPRSSDVGWLWPTSISVGRRDSILAARQAAIELHHFSDFVLNNPAPPIAFSDLGAVRAAVQSHLIFLREPKAPHVDDVALLRDVADAFKYQKLDRPSATVDGADAIITTGTGWENCVGAKASGEAPSRLLSSARTAIRVPYGPSCKTFRCLANVDGQPLPPIGKF